MSTTAPASSPLLERFAALKAAEPHVRARDAAAKLGVSEAELVAAGCGTSTTVRLRGPFGDLNKRFPELGRVMALTRNEYAVHERKGIYQTVEIFGPMGQVVGPDIDLRLFLGQWKVGFALREPVKDGTRRSLQFFDPHGTAVQKIYLQPEGNEAAFEQLVADFTDEDQGTSQLVTPAPAATPDRADESIDVADFRAQWDALENTHEFFGLLRKFKIGRVQALRLAGPERARAVALTAPTTLLEKAAALPLPIMVFVGNRGLIQIHTGEVRTVKPMGPWINVLDPEFNLHLRQDGVASAWVVQKATKDGPVTSLEIYDHSGENIALFFGKRKPGHAEMPEWASLVNSLN